MSEKEVISLKEFFKVLIDERDKQIYQRFDAMEKAVIKAEIAHEKRLESMNEFRGQLGDQAKTFLPRAEFVNLKERVDKMENMKQGGGQTWNYLIIGLLALIAFISMVVNILRL